jgi:hypothetical protein
MSGKDTVADFDDALTPGVVGLQIRYTWRELEPAKGQYDFSRIESDLHALAARGAQLVVFIQDKSFGGEQPAPDYMLQWVLANRVGGFTAARWQPQVVERLNALTAALAATFDCHPSFEGIALQESALSLDDDALDDNNYSAEGYAKALTTILSEAAKSMPRSRVFWYMNFLPRNQRLIADVAASVAPLGVAMGGPDVLPDNEPLARRTYPFYNQFRDRMTLFNSMQFDSYAHTHATGPAAGQFWTMEELFEFARDQLQVDYLFWNRKTWRRPAGSYNWSDARAVIAAHPQIQAAD